MCEHTKQLITWMDGELAESEAAAVAGHVGQCAECRECLAAYKQASAGFEMYCDATLRVAEEARAQKLREIPRLAGHPSVRPHRARLVRDDTVKTKATSGGLKDAATKAKRAVAIGTSAMAAAAAIAMLLMLPRHRIAQTPAHMTESARNAAPARTPATAHNAASTPSEGGPLHAVQRAAESIEVTESAEHTEKVQVPARQSEAPAAAGTLHAAQRELPDAHVAQRTAPMAVSTSTAHRRAAGRPARPENASRAGPPARLEDATGAARTLTAQDAQMRNANAALRPQGESKPQAENASAAEPPIEIAVSTENMFPPGAVPEGIGFTAVVTIAADDSAQLAALRQR